MSNLPFLLFFLFVSGICTAQQDRWDFGGQLYLNTSIVKHLKESGHPWFLDRGGIPGYSLGPSVRYHISETLFLKTGVSLSSYGDRNQWDHFRDFHLQIPLEAQMFLGKRFYLISGGTTSTTLFWSAKTYGERHSSSHALELFYFGASAGAGWEFPVGKEKQTKLFVQPTTQLGIYNTQGGFWPYPFTAGVTGGIWL